VSRRVVATSDLRSVEDVLARLGEPASAVEQGRVFVGRRRVRSVREPVQPGDEIEVHPEQSEPVVDVLGEWEGLYAVAKPAGLPTEPDRRGGASVLRSASRALGVAPELLHAVTRLDLPVSGIVVVACGPEAHRLSTSLQATGALSRRYLALSSRAPGTPEGTWDAPIGRDARGRPVAFGNDSREASTQYRVVATLPHAALLVAEPRTGRMHQIRIHAALAGAPLLGDVAHGGARRVVLPTGAVISVGRVALHAARVAATAGDRVVWSVVAPPPPDLQALWAEIGGEPGALEGAATAP
jgi:23S rRNA-/tRNA-specific pseudouridylate synthase